MKSGRFHIYDFIFLFRFFGCKSQVQPGRRYWSPLLAAAAGGQTECRIKLSTGSIYSVRDGALVVAVSLVTGYVDAPKT